MNSSEKIEQILDAAEEIMSAKGLQASSIAEIAKTAGVTDSREISASPYSHFLVDYSETDHILLT